MNRSKGKSRTFCSFIISCNYFNCSGIIRKLISFNSIIFNSLIFCRTFFVFGSQINPQLNHLKITAFLAPFFFVVFFMQNATCGSHPLYIAFANNSTATTIIVMCNSAFVGNSYSFETFMWMNANSFRFLRWRKIISRIVIHH